MNSKYSKWLLLLLKGARWPGTDPWLIKQKETVSFTKKGMELCESSIAFQAFHLSTSQMKYPVILSAKFRKSRELQIQTGKLW